MVHSIKNKEIKNIYLLAKYIRMVEEKIVEEYSNQQIRCPTHLSIGQELVPAILSLFINKKDLCVSTHRCHAHYLAKGGNLQSFIYELYGRSLGCSGGKGGSMHLIDLSSGFMGSSAIVGNSIPVGVGLGYNFKNQPNYKRNISIIYLGDGASEEGVFYESINLAIVKKIPCLFICENNFYSVYSNLSVRQPKNRKIYKMVSALGIHSEFCDGYNIQKVYKTLKKSVNFIRRTSKPVFLEFSTFRFREHCGPNFDDDLNYRNINQVKKSISFDPLNLLEKKLLHSKSGLSFVNNTKLTNQNKINKAFDKAINLNEKIENFAYQGLYKKNL